MKILALFFLTLMLSCKPADTTKSDFLQFVQKGKINSSVLCKTDQSLSYALYLPSNYNLSKEWGIIYCFDPKGDGVLPVNLLKDIAEKKSYILVGSNNSKNGTDAYELSRILDILLSDTQNKLNIDKKHIYYLGFSGGARVAASAALTYGNAAGVIGCSAGFQPNANQIPFNFIGIAGNDDMNFMEVKMLDGQLNVWPTNHLFIEFNGKHNWPSEKVMEQAITCLELFEMQTGKRPIDNALASSLESNILLEIENSIKTNNVDSLADTYKMLENAIKSLNSLTNIWKLLEKQKELAANNDLMQFLEYEADIAQKESALHQTYMNQYTTESLNWWKQETQRLNKGAISSNNSTDRHSFNRSLQFISLMSYSYVNSAIKQRNWDTAEHFLTIYGYADPENADYLYFSACVYANTNRNSKSLEFLRKALASGSITKGRAKNDALLTNLRGYKEFDEMVN